MTYPVTVHSVSVLCADCLKPLRHGVIEVAKPFIALDVCQRLYATQLHRVGYTEAELLKETGLPLENLRLTIDGLIEAGFLERLNDGSLKYNYSNLWFDKLALFISQQFLAAGER